MYQRNLWSKAQAINNGDRSGEFALGIVTGLVVICPGLLGKVRWSELTISP